MDDNDDDDAGSITLEVHTATALHAGTQGVICASFLVDDVWTDPELFFVSATPGAATSTLFWTISRGFLSAIPSHARRVA